MQPPSLEMPASSDYSIRANYSGAPTLRLPWSQASNTAMPSSRPSTAPENSSVLKGGTNWHQQRSSMQSTEPSLLQKGNSAVCVQTVKRPGTPAALQPRKSSDFEAKKPLPGIHSPSASPISSPSMLSSSGFPGFHSRKTDVSAAAVPPRRTPAATSVTVVTSDAKQPRPEPRVYHTSTTISPQGSEIRQPAASSTGSSSTPASKLTQLSSSWQASHSSFLPTTNTSRSVMQTSQGRGRQFPAASSISSLSSSQGAPGGARTDNESAVPQARPIAYKSHTSRRKQQEQGVPRSGMTQSALLLAYGAKGQPKRSAVKGGLRPTSAAAMMANSQSQRFGGSNRLANTASAYAIRQAHVMGQRRQSEARSSSQTRRERTIFNRGGLSSSSRL